MTNIDRLHDSLNCRSRQCGKTRALLHSIIGEIQIGWNDKIFLFCKYRDIKWIIPELEDALDGQWITIRKRSANEIHFINYQGWWSTLYFLTGKPSEDRLVGCKNTAVFELD